MKKLTEFSVKYPVTVIMLMLGVVLLGIISLKKLSIDLLPDMTNPRIFIEIKSGERPPEEIEKKFVENIESLVIRQKDVIQVTSISRVGEAQVTAEYIWNADMDEAFLNVQKALTSYSQNEDIDELTISQHDPNAAPIMILGFSHPDITDKDELRKTAQNYLRNELVRLEGIAEVEILGQEEKEVVIDTNPYLLEAYNLTQGAIASRINEFNRNVSGGSIVEMGRKYIIKSVSEFNTPEDLAHLIVTYNQQQGPVPSAAANGSRVPVYLQDVADISLKIKEPENIVRINQKGALALAVYKETKFNTVKAVRDLKKALVDIRKSLPGYDITVIKDQGEFISQSIGEVKNTLLLGILLAVIVLFVFLRRIGTTIIISIAIPISVIATFNLMYFNGLTLNIMTLGGLALGAGMLVDNAIVVMENIFRLLEEGAPIKQAATEGTAQVGGAITASTLTTIVVFLPIVYLHGAAGELFKDQAWTVAFSLLSSLVVAILAIPMLTSMFIKKEKLHFEKKAVHFPRYKHLLEKALEQRRYIWILASLLIVSAVLLIPKVGSEFMPKSGAREYTVDLQLPQGTDLRTTEKTVEDVEFLISSTFTDQLDFIYSKIGPSVDLTLGGENPFENEGTASIQLVFNKKMHASSDLVVAKLSRLLDPLSDIEYQVVQEQTALQNILGIETAPIIVEIKGDDIAELERLTNQVKEKLLAMDDLYNVTTSFDEGRPEIDLVVDRLRAGTLNVSPDEISSQVRDQLAGRDAGQLDYEGELKDITIRFPQVDVSELKKLDIESNGQKVGITDLADLQVKNAPDMIYRVNQRRIGRITAHIGHKMPFDKVVARIDQNIKKIDFPAGVQYDITGEEQKRKDAFSNLKFALLLSLVLVYMVLASQFESLLHPFTILLTIPFAGVGAVYTFFLLGKTFNVMAYIGIIMLIGIAVNDSIILVDAINQLKRDGLGLREAVLEAGQRRIRPIIMTSLTTILALLPLTIGFGEGAALRSPMALAVIGGLVSSTLLTLVVIPCVYYQIDLVKQKSTARWSER
jgi:HAE1 family hydrophobic/amphiphilic exporter-1